MINKNQQLKTLLHRQNYLLNNNKDRGKFKGNKKES